ncbi:MAG: DMT family transporter [Myxococcales bacterium]|jgi:drug/metabolite transporter (DMT)-like permease|nr:DMT family transporter [Myxococcales bacterium]
MRNGGREDVERAGLVCAGLCALNGAFVPAVARLTSTAAAPLTVATVSSLFAGALALAVLAVRGELGTLFGRATGPRLALVGLVGTALAFGLFYAGTSRTSAIDAALALQVEPIYSLVGAWAVLGHRPTLRRVAALAVLVAGLALALGAHRLSSSVGIWLVLATPLCWQLSHLLVLRRLQGVAPAVLTGARYVYGGLILAFAWLASGGNRGELAGLGASLPLLAFQGTVLSYLGTIVWYAAIARLDLARTTAIVVPAIPVLSLAASFALLGEVPTPRQALGMALTAAGILAFVTAPHLEPRPRRIPSATAPIAAE